MYDLTPHFPRYTHLVLSGGGMSGLVYIGIYRFLQQYRMLESIHYISGTSIGAVFGFIFGLRMEYQYVEELFLGTTNRGGLCTDSPAIVFDPKAVFTFSEKQGLYTMERFRQYLTEWLQKKYQRDDMTFAEYMKITGVDFHVNVTCLNNYQSLDLCNQTHPEMSVITAILASMSVPLFFEPIVYKDCVMIDGGCCENLPISWIEHKPSHKVLAINLGIEEVFRKEDLLQNIGLYGYAILLSMITSHTKNTIREYKEKADILEINKNPIPFVQAFFEKEAIYTRVSREQVEEGILYGYHCIHTFFDSKGFFSQNQ